MSPRLNSSGSGGRSSARGFTRGVGIAALTLACAGFAHAGGGGGDAVFTLDRTSPTRSLYGYSAADLFVDDSGYGPGTPLTVALSWSGLGLTPGACVTSLSSGRDNGIPAILGAIGLVPNPLDLATVRYQFSVDRTAVDGVTGPVSIPFVALPLNIEQSTPLFPDQFTNLDQAADVFDNVVNVDRFNFVQMIEEYLKLRGRPVATIDNLNSLESMGSFGVQSLDSPPDGMPDVPIYFTVDGLSGGLPTSSIFVKPAGAMPRRPYAVAADLGLALGDSIDALSIWDDGLDLSFNPGDGVVFSLTEGSASLPMMVGGVMIDGGGIFLSVPGSGIVAALPGGYFSLSAGDELDAIHVVDPRVADLPPCLGTSSPPSVVRPFEALTLFQSQTEPMVGGPLVHVAVYLNETERFGDPSGVSDYAVTATSLNPSVATIESAVPSWCGWEPGFPTGTAHCEQCGPPGAPTPPDWTGPCPGTTGTLRAWYIRGLEQRTRPLMGSNACLGDFHIRPVGPGWARIIFSGSATGDGGMAKTVANAEMVISVSGAPGAVPGDISLPRVALAVAPNPSRVRTDLTFEMPAPGGLARLEVFDLSGRRVRELLVANLGAGPHRVTWNGRDDAGNLLGRGLYLVRLETPSGTISRKVARVQ